MIKDTFRVRIYYEDTDCGNVVYYANYLKYFERARTDLLEKRGISLKRLIDDGIYFVVAEANVRYLSPGRYGDILLIETEVDRVGSASIVFKHRVERELTGERLVEGTVKLGCVGTDMKPMRLRHDLLNALTDGIDKEL